MDGSLVLWCWLVIWLSCCICFKIWFCSIFCGEPAPGPDFLRIKIFEPHLENFTVFPPTMPLFGSQCPVLGTSCAANLDFFWRIWKTWTRAICSDRNFCKNKYFAPNLEFVKCFSQNSTFGVKIHCSRHFQRETLDFLADYGRPGPVLYALTEMYG